ncbi:Lrp/AsnC family transcriptional regulator [Kordiimonas pumila]|uniref:Lrp/AsnC family transcriptional regulator n=1 Tax=Kordiimonas pumila TaxID=2161677 RepID=A0ABV7D6N8_9PROT|nr:Lrp/AsnC family transcriptional regulator [Kordiimonas pumila]
MKNLDKIDIKILQALTRDGRISWRELADEVGLSLTPTLRRVRQMEDNGIIKGYTAELDENKLLGSMAAFISITLDRQVDEILHIFEDNVSKLPEVMSGHLMSGGADYLLHVYVRDLEHYREFLSVLSKVQGIAHIQSSFVLNTFTQRTAPMVTKR